MATTPLSILSSKCSPGSSIESSPERSCQPYTLQQLIHSSTLAGQKLEQASYLPLELIQQWAAELCSALFNLHTRGLAASSLRPENLLLDLSGSLVITYQCQWSTIDRPVVLDCYAAPELEAPADSDSLMVGVEDWWSVGVVLFELYTGTNFCEMFPSGLLPHTPAKFEFSCRRSEDDPAFAARLEDLISGFLKPLPEHRLGYGPYGQKDVQTHEFFNGLDWSKL